MWKTVPTTPGVLYWYEPSTQLLTTSKYTDLASSSITVCIASSLFANHEELQSLLDFLLPSTQTTSSQAIVEPQGEHISSMTTCAEATGAISSTNISKSFSLNRVVHPPQ